MTVFLQALFTGLTDAGLLMAVSVGLALVFGVMGVVNFAHGALLMVSMYAAIELGDLGSIWVTTLLLSVLMAARRLRSWRASPCRRCSPSPWRSGSASLD